MSCLSACPNQLGDEFSNEGTASTLEEVLANGNTTGPHQIVVSAGQSINASASGATVLARTLYIDSIAPLTFPIGDQIGILGGLTFPGDINLRNNAQSGGTAVTIDSIPAAPTTQANVVSYDPTSKNLYYQAAGGSGVATVSAGTNISVTGTATDPIINIEAPLTSQLDVGNQIITSTTGDLVVSAPAGGINMTSLNATTILGGSLSAITFNEDIAGNTATANIGIGTHTGSVNIITAEPGGGASSAGISASTALSSGLGLGASIGGGSSASAGIQVDLNSGPISQLALSITNAPPFAYNKSATYKTDGITQSNDFPGSNPYIIQTNQDLNLTLTGSSSVIRVPNGNSIITNDTLNTTTVAKDGVQSQFFQSNPGGGVGVAQTAVGNATAQLFLGATDLTTLNQNTLRAELQANTGVVIDHETVAGTIQSLTMRTEGTLNLTAGYGASGATTALPVQIASSGVGGAVNPGLRITNTNATGSCALEIYKNKPTAGAVGDVLYNQSVFGKDSTNAKQEYTRISHTIRDPANTAEDGSIEIGCFTNGAYANYIQLNANDAPIGEVNIFRPIDFIGGSDANATIKTSGTGSVNLNLDSTASAGAGAIALKTKDGVAGSGGGLLLTGNTLLSGSAGGNSGQHLCLTIGGVVYKIALLLP